jgi:hypothetical protein
VKDGKKVFFFVFVKGFFGQYPCMVFGLERILFKCNNYIGLIKVSWGVLLVSKCIHIGSFDSIARGQ